MRFPPDITSHNLTTTTTIENADNTLLPPMSAPLYSSYPLPGEQVLAIAKHGSLSPFCGTIVKRAKHAAVALNHQRDGSSTPTYTAGAAVDGEVSLAARDIVSVELKLEGHIRWVYPLGSGSIKTIDITHRLWDKSCSSSGKVSCPSALPFSFVFPTKFCSESGQECGLPPSFHVPVIHTATSLFYANIEYWLALLTTHTFLGVMTQTKEIRIPVKYVHRTRPRDGIVSTSLLSSIKSCPDDWIQTTTDLEYGPEHALPPLSVELFAPSSSAFAISDPIPFHLHISGSLFSIRELSGLIPDICLTSANGSPSKALRVFIVRQVVVETPVGRGVRSNIILAEGRLRPLPPALSSSDAGRVSLDWEGELACEKSVDAGGFHTPPILVKDFIVFSFNPAPHARFLECRISLPVRLTTEPWISADDCYG